MLANIAWRSRIDTRQPRKLSMSTSSGYCISLAWTWFVCWFQVSSFKYFSTEFERCHEVNLTRNLELHEWLCNLVFGQSLWWWWVSTCWPVPPETQRGKGWIRQRLLSLFRCVEELICFSGRKCALWNWQALWIHTAAVVAFWKRSCDKSRKLGSPSWSFLCFSSIRGRDSH